MSPILYNFTVFACWASIVAADSEASDGRLGFIRSNTPSTGTLLESPTPINASSLPAIPSSNPPPCDRKSTSLFLPSSPYANYFLSTCNVQSHVILTSPVASSNLSFIGPRLIAAFPAGNSGVATVFAPESGVNGSLSLGLVNTTEGSLDQVYVPAANGSDYPSVGISAVLEFNDSAVLTLPILGSIRNIHDFTEGPSIIVPEIQDAISSRKDGAGIILERTWLDNRTTTILGFLPVDEGSSIDLGQNNSIKFSAGNYRFWAAYNFPQLNQLEETALFNNASQGLTQQQPSETSSLAFLSYTDKLLAGIWRFLTYFGRDSMIAALLLELVLSTGEKTALEAVLIAVYERINRTDGAHEETLGDYATYLNLQENITSSDPSYTYQMIDTDYFLPILMERYFLHSKDGSGRAQALLATESGKVNPANRNLTYSDLSTLNAEKIMTIAGRFAAEGSQTIENLAHLKQDQVVGQWRDSTYGIGGGRIPYDVNTAFVPAALRSIAALSSAGLYPDHPEWNTSASSYAKIWEDSTIQFFTITLDVSTSQSRLETYTERSSFPGPSQADNVTSLVTFDAIALDGNNLPRVDLMHTDTCFRLFLLNTTNQAQLTSFINRTATSIRQRFPAGLMTDVGLLVANPAYGEEEVYARNFTSSAYHGTVVWSWQQAMMARGLEIQIARCKEDGDQPEWCRDEKVYENVKGAYNELWGVIEANRNVLSGEVWSWRFEDGKVSVCGAGRPAAAGWWESYW